MVLDWDPRFGLSLSFVLPRMDSVKVQRWLVERIRVVEMGSDLERKSNVRIRRIHSKQVG